MEEDNTADRLEEILESQEPQLLATGFVFTEGPVWDPNGDLLFVDIRQSLIYRLPPQGTPSVARDNSGGNNGLTFDLEGRLIMCEGDNRQISRLEPNGTVTAVVTDKEYPNGLAFSPDESILYVDNTRQSMHINAYDVQTDGTVANGRVFADMSSTEPDGVPDGMKVDARGRVYCTGPGGCWVFEPDGTHLGIIRLPEIPANCAWGGPDYQTMYFTARTSVYSMRMKTAGARMPAAGHRS